YYALADRLRQQCDETMKRTINVKSVHSYYTCAATYTLHVVKAVNFGWFLNYSLTHQKRSLYHFQKVSINLMKRLVSYPELPVMQKQMERNRALK
ncbi:hypothetical protein DBR06_SOUSAS57110003, partial [Sousa chinensis]